MAQTLAANLPGVTQMKLIVDGKERTTLAGHAGLAEPYAMADAAKLVAPPPPDKNPLSKPSDAQGVQAKLVNR